MSQKKVYIEQTKKDIKIGKMICWFLFFFGLYYISQDASAGGLIIILSICGSIYYSIKRWWDHG